MYVHGMKPNSHTRNMNVYKTVAKYKDDTDWKDVSWGGLTFISSREHLQQLVDQMRVVFPLIEYKIVEA